MLHYWKRMFCFVLSATLEQTLGYQSDIFKNCNKILLQINCNCQWALTDMTEECLSMGEVGVGRVHVHKYRS